MKKFNQACINLFKLVIPEGNFNSHISEFTKAGIVTEPGLYNSISDETKDYIIERYGIDPFTIDNTLHRDWNVIDSMSIEEYCIHQAIHYLITIGFEHLGIHERDVYFPTEKMELPDGVEPNYLTLIRYGTREEVLEQTIDMVMSGVALRQDVIDDLVEIIDYYELELDLEQVKNREIQAILYKKYNRIPSDPDTVLRVLKYIVNGDTEIVRSARDMYQIKEQMATDKLDEVYQYFKLLPVEVIAKDFNRNRMQWFGYRGNSSNSKTKYIRTKVNQASKLANNVSKTSSYNIGNLYKIINSEDITSNLPIARSIIMAEPSLKNLVKIITYFNSKLAEKEFNLYRIRNQRTYINEKRPVENREAIKELLDLANNRVKEKLKQYFEGEKIYIPDYIEYKIPATLKSSIQGVPEGSYINYNHNLVVGIHWKNVIIDDEEERTDLDLKFMSESSVVGWDAYNRDDTVLFSGDVTSADISTGGATEAGFIENNVTDPYIIMVNNYTDEYDVPCELLFEETEASQFNDYEKHEGANTIFDYENTRKLNMTVGHGSKKQQAIGMAIDGKLYFSKTSVGYQNITSSLDDMNIKYLKAVKDKLEELPNLREYIDPQHLTTEIEEATIDLSLEKITEDTFIKLLY